MASELHLSKRRHVIGETVMILAFRLYERISELLTHYAKWRRDYEE